MYSAVLSCILHLWAYQLFNCNMLLFPSSLCNHSGLGLLTITQYLLMKEILFLLQKEYWLNILGGDLVVLQELLSNFKSCCIKNDLHLVESWPQRWTSTRTERHRATWVFILNHDFYQTLVVTSAKNLVEPWSQSWGSTRWELLPFCIITFV